MMTMYDMNPLTSNCCKLVKLPILEYEVHLNQPGRLRHETSLELFKMCGGNLHYFYFILVWKGGGTGSGGTDNLNFELVSHFLFYIVNSDLPF